MADVDFQNFSTVHSALQPKPATITAAATIAPTTFLSFISGTTAIVTVTPPVSGAHMLILMPLAAFTMTTAGNVKIACTAAVNSPVVLIWNPNDNKYWNSEIAAAS
jgi:hypothetical protein